LIPEKALVIEELDGKEKLVEIQSKLLKKGRKVRINEGGQIPCDGIVFSGEGRVNEAILTGENLSKSLKEGDFVYAGTILIEGNIVVVAEKNFAETTLAGIIDLVKNAQMNPPSIQKIGDKVSAFFVPAIILISILAFCVSFFGFQIDFRDSVLRSIGILVISCPCAMGLATPTAIMVGIGRAAKQGILFRSGDVLEKFAQSNVIIFDKTGTLTEGSLIVNSFTLNSTQSETEVTSIACGMAKFSNHPLSKAISKLNPESDFNFKVIAEVKGLGLEANDELGNSYRLGSAIFTGQEVSSADISQVYLTRNNTLLATYSIEDKTREGIKETIDFFKNQGFRIFLMSGDQMMVCNRIASELGISEIYHSCLPDKKQKIVEELSEANKVVMVGDGINDAAALASALVGISHIEASSIAINSAGLVITAKDFSERLVESYLLSKATLRTIKQNLFWAFCYNIIAIPLAGFGFLNPMLGTASRAFSDLMVIGNSLLLRNQRLD
jgi:Cu+-exporting ATPase